MLGLIAKLGASIYAAYGTNSIPSANVFANQSSELSSHHQMPVLQYADDTCLTANSKANCQAMLRTTEKCLDWSLLKAKVLKCAAISICGQTGKTSNPHLVLSNAKIPYLGNKSMSFLGLPINAVHSTDCIKEQLALKLEKFLTVTDRSTLSRQQKLRVYKDAICPRLSWLLSLTDLPLSWVKRMLEPQVTKMLKNWCGLSRSADPSVINSCMNCNHVSLNMLASTVF